MADLEVLEQQEEYWELILLSGVAFLEIGLLTQSVRSRTGMLRLCIGDIRFMDAYLCSSGLIMIGAGYPTSTVIS